MPFEVIEILLQAFGDQLSQKDMKKIWGAFSEAFTDIMGSDPQSPEAIYFFSKYVQGLRYPEGAPAEVGDVTGIVPQIGVPITAQDVFENIPVDLRSTFDEGITSRFPVLDAEGAPVLDEEGNPVIDTAGLTEYFSKMAVAFRFAKRGLDEALGEIAEDVRTPQDIFDELLTAKMAADGRLPALHETTPEYRQHLNERFKDLYNDWVLNNKYYGTAVEEYVAQVAPEAIETIDEFEAIQTRIDRALKIARDIGIISPETTIEELRAFDKLFSGAEAIAASEGSTDILGVFTRLAQEQFDAQSAAQSIAQSEAERSQRFAALMRKRGLLPEDATAEQMDQFAQSFNRAMTEFEQRVAAGATDLDFDTFAAQFIEREASERREQAAAIVPPGGPGQPDLAQPSIFTSGAQPGMPPSIPIVPGVMSPEGEFEGAAAARAFNLKANELGQLVKRPVATDIQSVLEGAGQLTPEGFGQRDFLDFLVGRMDAEREAFATQNIRRRQGLETFETETAQKQGRTQFFGTAPSGIAGTQAGQRRAQDFASVLRRQESQPLTFAQFLQEGLQSGRLGDVFKQTAKPTGTSRRPRTKGTTIFT